MKYVSTKHMSEKVILSYEIDHICSSSLINE